MILTSSFLDSVVQYFEVLPSEIYVSLLVMLVIVVFSIIIGNKMKKADPLAPPSTAVLIGETVVGGISNFVVNMMGERFKKFTPYFLVVTMFLPLSFVTGLFGLPSPIGYIVVPLCLGLTTFVMIHATAIKYQKWGYFNRYVSPFVFMLPINLLTTPVVIISLTCRLLGNALAGTIIMTLIYWATGNVVTLITGNLLGGFNFIAPIIAPVFHAYFDLFGAFVQTLVFLSLSCLFIAAEGPEEA